MTANYIGILGWALIIGGALRHATDEYEGSNGVHCSSYYNCSRLDHPIRPLGIMGLVAESIATNGIEALIGYFQLLVLLLGSMIFVALVVNPLYPLYTFVAIHIHWYSNVCVNLLSMRSLLVVLQQNIPVNLDLAKRLKLNQICIPYPFHWEPQST